MKISLCPKLPAIQVWSANPGEWWVSCPYCMSQGNGGLWAYNTQPDATLGAQWHITGHRQNLTLIETA